MRKFMIYTAALASVSLIALQASAQTTATGTGTSSSGSASQSTSSSAGAIQGANTVQNGNSVSNGQGRATSNASTRSSSGSAATGNASRTYSGVNVGIVNQGGGGGDPGGYAGGGNGQPYGSTSWSAGDTTVRTAPTVYAPPVSGGNPCTLAVSGGVSVIGWGAAAGGTFVDQDCADRQKIAMVWNAGYKEAAKELMCNDQKTYMAFRTAGQPCAPRPEWERGAPVAYVAPMPIAPTPAAAPAPVQPKVLPRCNPARGIVDNCYSG